METRIKHIKKNTGWYYAVQVKRWIFWKTIYTDGIFANVEKFIDTLEQIDDIINNKTKSLNRIVYDGWAVRNVYERSGISNSINFFKTYPIRCKSGNNSDIIWEDYNGNLVPTMQIKCKKLFGKECLEPMKVRITIEQTEEQYK